MQMQVLHDDQILKGLYIIAILATISVLTFGAILETELCNR